MSHILSGDSVSLLNDSRLTFPAHLLIIGSQHNKNVLNVYQTKSA